MEDVPPDVLGINEIAYATPDEMTSFVRSHTMVAAMSLSRSVIVPGVGGGPMRLKMFQAREYCGLVKKTFLQRVPPHKYLLLCKNEAVLA